MTATAITFADLTKLKRRKTGGCQACGADVAGAVSVECRERVTGKASGKTIVQRSMGFCEPCAVAAFTRAITALEEGAAA